MEVFPAKARKIVILLTRKRKVMKTRMRMFLSAMTAVVMTNAAQVVDVDQSHNADVTVNNLIVPVSPPVSIMPTRQRQSVVQNPDAPGKVTEVRDEHIEVIDDKLELVTRTIKKTETRVVGANPPEDTVKEADVVVASAAVVVAATPPSLEPPAEESAETRRLVHYFCRCWKDGDYERMWWAMSPRYRLKAKYEEFCAVFVDDAKSNGGLKDENIGPNEHHDDWGASLDVELRFKLRRAKPRKVKVMCERTKDGYRISESGIIPIDLNNL